MILFMTVDLASIEKKLDLILETQQEIINFLIQKEKSALKGNILFLTDVIKNYKFNWENSIYKCNNHIKVLDIRQDSEQKIDFYRNQILNALNKKEILHLDQVVVKQIEKIKSYFDDYQLALYIYAFSSFLDVVLLENFDQKYLKGIAARIDDYSLKYKELYTTSFNQIHNYSKTSVESTLLSGLAKANKIAGNTSNKIPILGKSRIDEKLLASGEKVEGFNLKKIDGTMQRLTSKKDVYIRPFIENINNINRLYNNPFTLMIDREYLYIKSPN